MTLVLLLEMKLLFSGRNALSCALHRKLQLCPALARESQEKENLQLLPSAECCLLLAGSASGKTLKLDEFKTSP